MSERLDPVTLAVRRWAAEDRIIEYARSMVEALDLDPSHLEHMESACLHADHAGLESAVADLLQEAAARSG